MTRVTRQSKALPSCWPQVPPDINWSSAESWQASGSIERMADFNPEPPLGLGGIDASDKSPRLRRQACIRRSRHRWL